MFKEKTVLGVIPARSGSKGIRHKNITELAGMPLISYTISAMKGSNIFDRMVVSTDSRDIADITARLGAEAPFLRPPALSTDNASGMDVLMHAMTWVEDNDRAYDLVMYLQPTSPLRNKDDITGSLDLLVDKNGDAVVSVCEVDHSPEWSNTLPDDRSMKDFIKTGLSDKNRQALKQYYRLNGAIYLAKWNYIKTEKNWYGPRTYAYLMPRERSVDVDTEFDLRVAEILIKGVSP